MAKKSFKGGIDGLLGIPDSDSETFERKKSKPSKEPVVMVTFRIRESTIDYIRRICYWKSARLNKVVDKALKDHINQFIEKNGELQPVPKDTEYDV